MEMFADARTARDRDGTGHLLVWGNLVLHQVVEPGINGMIHEPSRPIRPVFEAWGG